MVRTILIWAGFAVAAWAAAVLTLVFVGRRTAAMELATLLPNLVHLFRGLTKDPRVSLGSKLWLWFAVAWFVSPIDLVPEFIPVLGPLDDAVVAALVLRHVLRRAGRDVVEEHWRGNAATLDTILRISRARS